MLHLDLFGDSVRPKPAANVNLLRFHKLAVAALLFVRSLRFCELIAFSFWYPLLPVPSLLREENALRNFRTCGCFYCVIHLRICATCAKQVQNNEPTIQNESLKTTAGFFMLSCCCHSSLYDKYEATCAIRWCLFEKIRALFYFPSDTFFIRRNS